MKRRKINYLKFLSLFFAIAALVFIAGCTGAPPTTPLINSFSAYPSTINEGESSTLTISQTEGTASAWFGASTVYVNVGQGQSFQVTEAGFFDQFQIYLSSTQSPDSGDIIVCDLRDSSGNVLQSASINGFIAGSGGWQTFDFNLGTYVAPGIYY